MPTMHTTIIVLVAALAALGGCASRDGYARDGDAASASPILTSRQDCEREGALWNAKLGVCEPRR
jgi:hypothetical protein